MTDPNNHPDKADTDVNDDTHEDIMYPSSIAFILVHLSCFGAIWSGVTWQAVVICVVLYWAAHLRHRRRLPPLLLAPLFDQPGVPVRARGAGQTSAQKGVLWWAAHHRVHHRFPTARRPALAPPQGFW